MPRRKKTEQDLSQFQNLLRRLLEESGESYRGASIAAGLGPNTVSNYIRGAHPMRDTCIALAEHFRINPNEMLKAAGYEEMGIFDESLLDPEQLSPDVKEFATKVQQIQDVDKRRRLLEITTELLQPHFPTDEEKTKS